VLGNKRLVHDSRAIKVPNEDVSTLERLRREEGIGVTVFGNQALRDNPKDLSPNFTNRVLQGRN
jgi:hypothetical protein